MTDTGEFAAMLRGCLYTFAEGLATTPGDQLAHRQPYRGRGDNRGPVTRREVLTDAMNAAADLLQAAGSASGNKIGGGGDDAARRSRPTPAGPPHTASSEEQR